MVDEEQDEKETNSDVDHSKNPDKAWETMREELSNTPELKKFAADFKHWLKTTEGKHLDGHREKSKYINKKFTKENINEASEDDFKTWWGKLYAARVETTTGQPSTFFENQIIKSNGGLENFRSKLLQFLDPKKSHDEQFEYGVKNIKGFADATISEILTDLFPQDCIMWNVKVRDAAEILHINKLFNKKLLKGKSLNTAEDYLDMRKRLAALKNILPNITDYLQLDHFFWYVATRNYWRLQPGTDKEYWDVFQNENIIAMDYSIPKDLTGCDKDKIDEIVRSVRKAQNKSRGKASSQLNALANQGKDSHFSDNMRIGDYVIINDGQSEILGSCVIRGDYKYDKTKPCPHTRKVEYLSIETKKIPKQNWSTTTSKKLDGWKEFNDIISGVSTTKTGETGLLPTQARKKLSEETYFNEDSITEIENELNEQRQIIFEGPPGTSKTYFAIKFAKYFTENKEDHVEIIQFHPSYNYEDFVEGIRPKIDKKREVKGYEIKDGILKRLATRARYDDSKFVLIIDEINRGKISRIFGELIYLLEYRNEEIRLTYSSDKKFQLPKNLYIIGTMNTADRSIALMDFALRRRFAFFGFKADSEILSKWLNGKGTSTKVTEKVVSLMDDINDAIAESTIGEECQIGQSYFMKENLDKNKLQKIFDHKILPLLKEYYFADKPQIVDIESKFNQVLKNWNVDGN